MVNVNALMAIIFMAIIIIIMDNLSINVNLNSYLAHLYPKDHQIYTYQGVFAF